MPKRKSSDKDITAPIFLAYAMPIDNEAVIEGDGFSVGEATIGSPLSFLDFDGIILWAGSFQKVRTGFNWTELACSNQADLDLRERELHTILQHGKPAIFLLPYLPQQTGYEAIDHKIDLFRRFAVFLGLNWSNREHPSPSVDSLVPEFRDYVSRYGSGYVVIEPRGELAKVTKVICSNSSQIFGVVLFNKVFLLPCIIPQSLDHAQQIILAAVAATIAYRKRISREMPTWITEFAFEKEKHLQSDLAIHQQKCLNLEGEISAYDEWKGALCFQSDPLVNLVVKFLDHFFGIKLIVEDKKIEDATLIDESGQVLAVVEIKGVKRNFSREDVNQVDSHRERLGLPSETPGILIMNTMMGSNSLNEKDVPPHPDIIKKAIADNVLLARTLDLLRFADGVEKAILEKARLRELFLGDVGWLRIQADKAEIVRE